MSDNTPPKKNAASRLGRASYITANILMPVSDIRSVFTTSGRSIQGNISRLKALWKAHKTIQKTQFTFEEAVAATGRTEVQLIRLATWKKRFWWCIAFIFTLFTPVLAMMVCLTATSLPIVTILRACTYIVMATGLAGIGMVNTLNWQYRRWQLSSRRLTPEEGGAFDRFQAETSWIKDSINPQ